MLFPLKESTAAAWAWCATYGMQTIGDDSCVEPQNRALHATYLHEPDARHARKEKPAPERGFFLTGKTGPRRRGGVARAAYSAASASLSVLLGRIAAAVFAMSGW